MKYNIREHYSYGRGTKEYTIDLGVLKFCQYNLWESHHENQIFSMWTVIKNASSDENKKFLKDLNKVCNMSVYNLPNDIAVINMWNIEFIDGTMPEFITPEEMNENIKPELDDVIWVDIDLTELQILSVYKLMSITSPDNVMCAEVAVRNICGCGNGCKSINTTSNNNLHVFLEHRLNFSDYLTTKVMTGDEARIIWSTLMTQVLHDMGYQPEYVVPDYDFSSVTEEYRDAFNALLNFKSQIEAIKEDESKNK